MAWKRREDTRSGGMAHGITFLMWEDRDNPQTRGEVAVNDRKLHLTGPSSLTLALGQHKYGNELIAQVFTNGPYTTAIRRNSSIKRVQVYLGAADIGTAMMLEDVASCIRRIVSEESVSADGGIR